MPRTVAVVAEQAGSAGESYETTLRAIFEDSYRVPREVARLLSELIPGSVSVYQQGSEADADSYYAVRDGRRTVRLIGMADDLLRTPALDRAQFVIDAGLQDAVPMTQDGWRNHLANLAVQPVMSASLPCVGCGCDPTEPGLFNRDAEDYLCRMCVLGTRSNGDLSHCEDCGSEWLGHYIGHYFYCSLHVFGCSACGRELRNDACSTEYDGYMCTSCFDARYIYCRSCDELVGQDEVDDYGYCENCSEASAPEEPPEDYRQQPDANGFGARLSLPLASMCQTMWSVPVGSPRPGYPFGVEIEVVFPNGDCPPLGDYHSATEAGRPFFSYWRAETDGSIRGVGGEFISPVLRGSAGIAEVLATFDLLDELEASVNNQCGQHIHVESELSGLRVQAITALLEDFAIATTGSYRRFVNSNYTPRLKAFGHQFFETAEDNARQGMEHQFIDGRSVVHRSPWGTYEFRYPPGTLNGSQFILNLGLSQLILDIGRTLSDEEIVKLLRNSATISREAGRARGVGGQWVHASIKEGASFVKNFADWKIGGSWNGISYQPLEAQPIAVEVQDPRRTQKREVDMPSQRDLVKRMERQLKHFYLRASRQAGWWEESAVEPMVSEIIELFR